MKKRLCLRIYNWIKGLLHLAQNKNTKNKTNKKTAFAIRKSIVKAVFSIVFRDEALKIHFYVCFLVAFLVSAVPLYDDGTKNATSVSK